MKAWCRYALLTSLFVSGSLAVFCQTAETQPPPIDETVPRGIR